MMKVFKNYCFYLDVSSDLKTVYFPGVTFSLNDGT